MVFAYISSFIFLIICIISGITLYRLKKTTVNAIITDVSCDSNKCDITMSYSINNIVVVKKITSKKNWKKNDTIRIFINPKDLNAPKYVSSAIDIFLYFLIGISILGIIVSIYFIFNQF